MLLCIAILTVVFLLYSLFWAVGFQAKLQRESVQWKILAFERHLYKGESRSELESQFGTAVPRPDLIDAPHNEVGVAQDYEPPKHNYGYYYFYGSEICAIHYDGVAVQYDDASYIKSWKRATFDTGGC